MDGSQMARRTGLAIAAGGAACIALATLIPVRGSGSSSTPSLCIACGALGGVDLVLNVLLFVPFGFGLRLARVSSRRAIFASFALTLLVELLQLRVVAGRDASLGDLLANALGGAIGVLVASRWRTLVAPSGPTARRLTIAGVVGWLSLLGATAWLLQPSIPYQRLWGQWVPVRAHLVPFEGRLLSLSVNEVPVERAMEVSRIDDLRAALTSDQARVEARVVAGPPTAKLAAIARVANPLTEAFLLGQEGRALVFRLRLRAADLRLRTPTFALEDVFPATLGSDTLDVAAGLRRGAVFLEGSGRGTRAAGSVALSPALGWSIVLPFDHPNGVRQYLRSALWIGGLLFPVAYWGAAADGRSSRPVRIRWQLMPAAAAILYLVAAPAFGDLPAAHWSEWIACAVALALGAAAFARARRSFAFTKGTADDGADINAAAAMRPLT